MKEKSMTGPKSPWLQAHQIALRLLDFLHDGRDLSSRLMGGTKPLDPDLVDVDVFRYDLEKCYREAEDVLFPTLYDFARVHQWPIEFAGYSVTSAHEGVMDVAEWMLGQTWSADFFTDFYAKYYTEENGIDWDAVCKDGVRETEWLGEMCVFGVPEGALC